MRCRPDKPLIVQDKQKILLEADHPSYIEVRNRLSTFAEPVKTPDPLHTYRMTPVSLWNAASQGVRAESILSFLDEESKFGLPSTIGKEIKETINRYGIFKLMKKDGELVLSVADVSLFHDMKETTPWKNCLVPTEDGCFIVPPDKRGWIKQQMIKAGYPIKDVAGYDDGEPLSLRWRTIPLSGNKPIQLRDYQRKAVDSFYQQEDPTGGSGVLVLPCGAGKTFIGMDVMEKVGRATLILTPNTTSVRQWIQELLDKMDLTEDQVGQYTGARKEVRPITVATYQILTHRAGKQEPFTHMKLFKERGWGLVIYDEVHLLPAPVFRATADIQACRRLGLTATLVREDERQEDVFSLIGPKKYEAPWKEIEQKGWIARAVCTEVRTPLNEGKKREYLKASHKKKYRIAAENPEKINVLQRILHQHQQEPVLVIGQYLDQLKEVAERLKAPLITGETDQRERNDLFQRFQRGEEKVLVVSKVANFAVDLPNAKVAVQISGTFGSRQEEAQRLGRVLRPKEKNNEAYFYHIVSKDTIDQDYALRRQLFLVEQGYQYQLMESDEWGGKKE
ncbi:DNA repair helicase XPB [Melghirimyces algeriensis]|uniref:DNA 3'-5' helicase n=1 Tax=Melghirimyces algeriensis TaxID=910412 RepID=A0A521CQT6_9BACL|nr:DNA repair helicase XPB [Melghirimyces algeriensis]SMO61817.1 DNA excision repair protein ERCC-3 [Melghirimyces algeriensis]